MMKRLTRIWTLLLDLVMLVMLLAAPVQAQKVERPARRPEQPYLPQVTGRGDFMSPNPAYVRVEERRTGR